MCYPGISRNQANISLRSNAAYLAEGYLQVKLLDHGIATFNIFCHKFPNLLSPPSFPLRLCYRATSGGPRGAEGDTLLPK